MSKPSISYTDIEIAFHRVDDFMLVNQNLSDDEIPSAMNLLYSSVGVEPELSEELYEYFRSLSPDGRVDTPLFSSFMFGVLIFALAAQAAS